MSYAPVYFYIGEFMDFRDRVKVANRLKTFSKHENTLKRFYPIL